jgi:hypothetical protein
MDIGGIVTAAAGIVGPLIGKIVGAVQAANGNDPAALAKLDADLEECMREVRLQVLELARAQAVRNAAVDKAIADKFDSGK